MAVYHMPFGKERTQDDGAFDRHTLDCIRGDPDDCEFYLSGRPFRSPSESTCLLPDFPGFDAGSNAYTEIPKREEMDVPNSDDGPPSRPSLWETAKFNVMAVSSGVAIAGGALSQLFTGQNRNGGSDEPGDTSTQGVATNTTPPVAGAETATPDNLYSDMFSAEDELLQHMTETVCDVRDLMREMNGIDSLQRTIIEYLERQRRGTSSGASSSGSCPHCSSYRSSYGPAPDGRWPQSCFNQDTAFDPSLESDSIVVIQDESRSREQSPSLGFPLPQSGPSMGARGQGGMETKEDEEDNWVVVKEEVPTTVQIWTTPEASYVKQNSQGFTADPVQTEVKCQCRSPETGPSDTGSCDANAMASEPRPAHPPPTNERLRSVVMSSAQKGDSLHAHLHKTGRDMTSLDKCVKQQKEEKAILLSQVREKDEDIRKLREKLQENTRSMAQLEEELAEEKTSHTHTRSRLKDLEDQVQETVERNRCLQETLRETDDKLAQYSASLADERNSHSRTSSRREELETQLKEIERRDGEFQSTLREQTAKMEGLEVRLREKEEENVRLLSEQEKMRMKLSQDARELEHLNKTLNTTWKQMADLQRKSNNTKTDMAEIQSKLNISENKNYELSTKVDIFQNQMEIKEQEMSDLNERLRVSCSRATELENELSHAKFTISTLTADLRQREVQGEESNHPTAMAPSEQLTNSGSQNSSLASEVDSLKSLVNLREEKMYEYERKLARLSTLQRQLSDQMSENMCLSRQIDDLNLELSAERTQKDLLSEDLIRYKASLRELMIVNDSKLQQIKHNASST